MVDIRYLVTQHLMLQWALTNPNSLGPVPIQISESFRLVNAMGHCGISILTHLKIAMNIIKMGVLRFFQTAEVWNLQKIDGLTKK